jgi:hypothetical protein
MHSSTLYFYLFFIDCHDTTMQDLVTSLDPNASNWLDWAGLRLPEDAPSATGGAAVEAALRCKALILLAVALKKRTFRLVITVTDNVSCQPVAPPHAVVSGAAARCSALLHRHGSPTGPLAGLPTIACGCCPILR